MIAGIPDRRRGIERLAGIAGLLISFLVVAAIFTGLDIYPERVNIQEDLSYLGENLDRLRINTLVWFINSILIILFGPLILMGFITHGRSSAYLAAFLISATGIIYLFFSLQGFNMIHLVSDQAVNEGVEDGIIGVLVYNILITKINLQLAAYSLSGFSSLILGLLIIRTGLIPKFIGWMAIAGGLIYGGMGWVSTDNLLFTFGRLLFVLSLILLGAILLLRGPRKKTEKQA